MKNLVPFSNASATNIRELTIETDEDTLVLSGSMEIRKDRAGLHDMERLLEIVSEAVHALRNHALPERSQTTRPLGTTIDNPFV